eukprot:jgi/Ulvmu1/8486/UM044_0020.1
MKNWFRPRMACFSCAATRNAILEESADHVETSKKDCATPNASHGASTRIGRGPDCSPWASAGDNAILKVKTVSQVDVPCSVAELEESDRTPSFADEAQTPHTDGSYCPGGDTGASSASHPGMSSSCDQGLMPTKRIDGEARPSPEPDDETTRRLARQIEEWGQEQHGPDIVAIAKAYVGIQKMAEEEALNHRFNMIKHDAIRLRPEAAHVFVSLQRNEIEDLDDTPLPRHC